MARSLTATMTAALRWTYGEAGDLATAATNEGLSITDPLASGYNAADVANRMFADTRAVAASSNDDIDLYAAAGITDPLGQYVSFGKIKGLMIHNKNTTAGDIIQVSGDGTQGWTTWLKDSNANSAHGVKVYPDGVLLLWNPSSAGYGVTPTTGDILRITEIGGANTVNYDLVLIGTNT